MTTLMKMDKGVFIPFLDQFMLSPLVTWVKTFVPDELGMHLDLNELLDGVFLNEVMTQINPTATLQGVSKVNGDPNQRIKNLNILVRQMKSYYLDTLRQLVMTPLPNVLLLVKTPYCEKSLEEMKKMLLLLLGCAVQCEKKEEYIERIQALDFDKKAAIAAHIQEVTHSQDNVLDLQWLEASELHPGELEAMVRSMALHLRCLLDQRDTHLETIAELTQAREGEVSPLSTPPSAKSAVKCPSMQQQQVGSQQHLAVELADYKAKIRRLRQELEEKSEQVLDCRNELDNMEAELKRVQQENTQLLVEARAARAYRDELDSLRERAVRSDRLESEVGRYREKLHSMELYKAKVDELKEDNRVLQETKEVLEDQVSGWRARSDKLHQLVKHNLLLKARMDELEQEKEVDHRRIEELQEENLSLCLSQRRSMEESQLLGWELEQLSKDTESSQGQQSLNEEVSEKARSRLLRLEKENRRLLTTIEELRTSYVSYSPQHNQHCVCQSSFINTLTSTTGQISGVHNSPSDRTDALVSGMANGDLKCNQRPETEQLGGSEQEAFVLDQEKGQLEEGESEEHLKEPASLHDVAGSHHHFPGGGSCWDCMVAGRPTHSRHASKHTERLETRCRELDTENQQLQASMDNTGRKLQRLEAEVQELEAENQGLQASLEKLRISARRLEQLEGEKQSFEQERAGLERDKRRLEKENRRLQQQVDIQEASLDSSSMHMASLQRDTHILSKELEGLREAAERLKGLERDNRELTKQAAIDQRTLVTLREELVSEKLRTQQRENELERLAHELEMRALNQGRPQQAEQESAENSRFKRLESELELCLTRSLQIKEDKMAALEDRLQESSTLNQHLRQELKLVKLNYEALQQRQEEEERAASSSTPNHGGRAVSEWQRESQEVTKELLRVKDRIIEVERNNATLEAERQALQVHLKQLEVQFGSQQTQILALQRQTASLQETNTVLQMHNANLQVEKSTLSSQSASLLAQNGQLQQRQSSLESEQASAARELEELRGIHGQLLWDHERLTVLHERQAADYEALMGKHGCLKNVHRTLELEHRTIQDRYNGLLLQRSKLEVLQTALKEEQEKMTLEKEQHRSAVAECRRLHDEKDWLNQTYRQLLQDNEELSADHKQLKSQSNTARLEHTHLEADFSKLKEQYQQLDITYAKLTNQCELLSQLKGNLEEENRHLLSQIQTLMLQNRTLLEQTMESKDMFHVEQRQYIDKLNELRRQKEKLEEKIMDQYKFYEPSPTRRRSNWIALKMKKLMKSRSRERGPEASLRPAAPARSGSCEGLGGPPPRLYCQDSGSVNGSGDAPIPAAAEPLSPTHRSTALRIFPRVRNRLADRDKVKSLFRRSVSLCDLAFPAVLSDEDQWESGPEYLGLPEDTAEMLSSSLTFSMLSILHLHLHHTSPPQGDSPTDASLSAPGAAELWVTDKDSNDNAVSPGIEDSELQHHELNPGTQGESSGEFSVSLDNEPWSNGSSPVQQPPSRRTISPFPAPGDTSTPRHLPRWQSSASDKESAKSPPALPVTSMRNKALRAAANQKDPGPSQGVWPMRTTNSIRKGFGSQACRRSSDTLGSLKLNRLLNGTAPKCDSAKVDSACSPACSPITVLYVQGKSPSVSGCLNCFSGPLGKEGRLRGFRSPGTLPRASSVISTAEGASRRSSVNSDCKVAASIEQNQQTCLSDNVEADAIPPFKPPRDPAMSGAAGSPKAPVQETLFGSPFTLSSVFSNTIFSDVLAGVGEGDNMNETSPCVSSCPLEFPAQTLEEKQNECLTEMDGGETKDRSS